MDWGQTRHRGYEAMDEQRATGTSPAGIAPVQRLLDRAEVVRVVDSVANALDAREWSYLRSLLLDEVEVSYAWPAGGELSRIEADVLVSEWRRTLTGFDATQHVVSNHAVRVAADTASCSAYVNATYYLPNYLGSDSWVCGSRADYILLRTRQGWRVLSLRREVLWARGNRQLLGLAQKRFEEGLTEGVGL